MKPFNLEEALAGKPVVTRDGRDVKELIVLKTKDIEQPIISVIGKDSFAHFPDGKFNDHGECDLDLFIKEEEVTLYANIYKSNNRNSGYICGELFIDKDHNSLKDMKYNSEFVSAVEIKFKL